MSYPNHRRPARPRLIRWMLGLVALAALGVFSVTALASSGRPARRGGPAVAGIAVRGHFAEASPQFRDCLSQHGIQPPAGAPAGASQESTPDSGTQPPAPPKDLPDPQKLQQALSACKQYLPADAQQKLAQMQAFQQCLSSHGVAPPMAVRTDNGAGPPDPQKFQQAFSACKQYLPAGAQLTVGVGPPPRLRQCLSAHGVKPPEAGGQPPSKATLQAAFQACRQYAPRGMGDGPGGPKGHIVFMTGPAPGPPPSGPPAGGTSTS